MSDGSARLRHRSPCALGRFMGGRGAAAGPAALARLGRCDAENNIASLGGGRRWDDDRRPEGAASAGIGLRVAAAAGTAGSGARALAESSS